MLPALTVRRQILLLPYRATLATPSRGFDLDSVPRRTFLTLLTFLIAHSPTRLQIPLQFSMLLLQRHRTISGRNRYYCFGEWMTTAAACVRELSPAAVGELSHDTPLLRVAAYACSHAVAFAQYAINCLLPRGLGCGNRTVSVWWLLTGMSNYLVSGMRENLPGIANQLATARRCFRLPCGFVRDDHHVALWLDQ